MQENAIKNKLKALIDTLDDTLLDTVYEYALALQKKKKAQEKKSTLFDDMIQNSESIEAEIK